MREQFSVGLFVWIYTFDVRTLNICSFTVSFLISRLSKISDHLLSLGNFYRSRSAGIRTGAKNTASMKPGERIIIHTPGGGGWGKEGEKSKVEDKQDPQHGWKKGSVAGRQMTAEASA